MKAFSRAIGPVLFVLYPFLLLWSVMSGPVFADAFAPPVFFIFGGTVVLLTIALTVYWIAVAFRPARPDGWWRPRRRDWIVAGAIWIAGFAGLAWLFGRVAAEAGAVKISNSGRNVVAELRERAGLDGFREQAVSFAFVQSSDATTAIEIPLLGPAPGEWQSANAWFASLLADGSLRAGSPYDIFVPGPGGPDLGPGADGLATNRCLWNCLAGIDGCPSDATPFLWSANLGGVAPEDFAGADPARPRSWKDRVDRKRIPGLGRHVVVIRKSGRMDIRPADQLTDVQFLGGSSNDPARIQVLPARP